MFGTIKNKSKFDYNIVGNYHLHTKNPSSHIIYLWVVARHFLLLKIKQNFICMSFVITSEKL